MNSGCCSLTLSELGLSNSKKRALGFLGAQTRFCH